MQPLFDFFNDSKLQSRFEPRGHLFGGDSERLGICKLLVDLKASFSRLDLRDE